jgi:hypothetical protein
VYAPIAAAITAKASICIILYLSWFPGEYWVLSRRIPHFHCAIFCTRQDIPSTPNTYTVHIARVPSEHPLHSSSGYVPGLNSVVSSPCIQSSGLLIVHQTIGISGTTPGGGRCQHTHRLRICGSGDKLLPPPEFDVVTPTTSKQRSSTGQTVEWTILYLLDSQWCFAVCCGRVTECCLETRDKLSALVT